MADFALFVSAAEPALPWTAGEFLKTYRGNRDDAVGIAIEASPIAGAIIKLIEDKRAWQGTAGGLLSLLNDRYKSDGLQPPKDWPANRKAMANAVRRIAPALRSMGFDVQIPDKATGRKKERIICISLSPGARSARSASSANPPGASEAASPPTESGSDADHAPVNADHAQIGGARRGTSQGRDPGSPARVAGHADHADHPPGDSEREETESSSDDEEELL